MLCVYYHVFTYYGISIYKENLHDRFYCFRKLFYSYLKFLAREQLKILWHYWYCEKWHQTIRKFLGGADHAWCYIADNDFNESICFHDNDYTWVSWRLKSPAKNSPLINSLFRLTIKKQTKLSNCEAISGTLADTDQGSILNQVLNHMQYTGCTSNQNKVIEFVPLIRKWTVPLLSFVYMKRYPVYEK